MAPVPARRLLAWGLGVGLGGFLLLAGDQLWHGPVYRADFPVDDYMTQWAAQWPFLHDLGNGLSQPGSGTVSTAVVAGCTVLLWLWREGRRAAFLVAGSLTGAVAVTVLKPAIGRPLPPFIQARFPHGYGFPSGHTIGATVSIGLCILLVAEAWISRHAQPAARTQAVRRQALAASMAVAVMVGMARILAQTHWVSDVLGAWSLGVAIVCATLLLAGEWRATGAPAVVP